jgi:type II/III secretion system protein
MFRIIRYSLAVLALAMFFVPSSLAQQTTAKAQDSNTDSSISEKGFKNKVFEIKYRDARSLANVLTNLGSGFRGATMSANSEFKTLTVRDFPENIATIEEAIKRLDTPAAPRPNIELHMHVLIASNTPGGATDVPAELKDVLAQLRGTFNYKSYELATSIVQRLTETPRGLRGKGAAEISGPSGNVILPYEYVINQVTISPNPAGATTVQINEFSFVSVSDRPPVPPAIFGTQAQIETALNLRDGEKVVVGTATMRDRALIVVLSAKLVN